MSEELQKIERALDYVQRLNQPRGTSGSLEWIMRIPAEESDPDLVIAGALHAAKEALAERDVRIAELERDCAAFELQCSTQVEELQKAEARIAKLEREVTSLLPYCKRD